MVAPLPTETVNLTPNRLRWLKKLAKDGPCSWQQMPKQNGDRRSSTHLTWGPLKRAGLITAEFTERDGVNDWHFTITPEGRKFT